MTRPFTLGHKANSSFTVVGSNPISSPNWIVGLTLVLGCQSKQDRSTEVVVVAVQRRPQQAALSRLPSQNWQPGAISVLTLVLMELGLLLRPEDSSRI